MKRLFAAIKIRPDNEFMARLHRLEAELGHEKIKWVEDQNIHVTLKFFGDTEERKIPEIMNVLKKVAGENAAFGISLKSLGIFGSRYDPRVLWVGIEPYDLLVNLMKDLHLGLKEIGYEPERQNLVPHLTIGRIKGIRDREFFQKTVESFRDISSSVMKIPEILLFESILKREGPVYLVQGTVPLAGSSG